jgi:hypothetical protein
VADRSPIPADDASRGISALLAELAAPGAALGGAWEEWLHAGPSVGRFELVREIGRGGFGVVWEARDRELGRAVAFKAVRASERAAFREERLLREAEAAARLSHPNIVTLYDVGRSEHGPYLVLELLRGQTLESKPIPTGAREALRIATDISANQTLALHEITRANAGVAAGIYETGQRIGTALATALSSALFFGGLATTGGDYHAAVGLGLASPAVLVGVAFLIGTADILWPVRRAAEVDGSVRPERVS